MGMPQINIAFSEAGSSVIKRGERGIVALILKDAACTPENKIGAITCVPGDAIPSELSKENREQIQLAQIGYTNAPSKVIVYVLQQNAKDYSEALDYLKTVKFDYLAIPTAETDEMVDTVASYIKAQREERKYVKAVLPNAAANTEGVINFTTKSVTADDNTYTTEQYCARIAGLIAGTPLAMSATYAPLSELTDCERLTRAEMDAAVDAGQFIAWWDGEKVKTGRAVNSLTAKSGQKGEQYQKIKIVEAMDMISYDIRKTAEDEYIGKFSGTYANKCQLLAAIIGYFDKLILDEVIAEYEVGFDIEAIRSYLKGKGTDTDGMSDDEIKRANTGSKVFLKATLKILDAIEDIELPIVI